jgi:polyisoprenoid-binding protein YceI
MTTTLDQDLPAATWALDTTHSTAGFAINYLVSTFRAGFDALDVTLDTAGDQPRLTGSVDPRSIAVKDENLHAQLQEPGVL